MIRPGPNPRLRVLLIAEACNPEWQSVPLVGFNFARALAARTDLEITLATHVRNQDALERDGITRQVDVVPVNNEWIARPMYLASRLLRGGNTLSWTTGTAMAWPGYMAFETQLARMLRTELTGGRFDLIHRITPVSPTLGSPLAGMTTTPFVIGPLNGGLPWPSEFPDLRHQEREWLQPFRQACKRLPWYQRTYRSAAAVIAGSRHTATEIPDDFSGRRCFMPENGIDPHRFPLSSAWQEPTERFRFVTAGRLVPYKGVDLILEAMAGSPALRRCELQIVGDGPFRPALQGMVNAQHLENCVHFSGALPQTELGRAMSHSQAFVFPSLREFGGAVVLEAMACGLPSIIVDYGGPSELVTPRCAVSLPLRPRDQLVHSLRAAMESLAVDFHRCRRMSQAAVDTVRRRYTWDAKAEQLVSWYHDILQDPDTDMHSLTPTTARTPVPQNQETDHG